MKQFQLFLARYRALTFCIITFAITWIYEFAVVYPLVGSANVLTGMPAVATFAIGGAMFFPAIGMVLTRLITGEGFKNLHIKPLPFGRSFKWFVFAWFVPAVLIAVGAALYFMLFPGDFDPTCSGVQRMIDTTAALSGASPEIPVTATQLVWIQIAVGVFLGPLLNIVTTFGEEWGWRGYLVPELAKRMGIVPNMLVSGAIWGLWHAPITALGHNYGLGYAGYPWTGILAMMALCVCFGILLTFVTVKTGSCLAAAVSHGAINSLAAAPAMFSLAGGNPFIGPAPTGIIGGCGFIVAAVILLVVLRRSEKAGRLTIA